MIVSTSWSKFKKRSKQRPFSILHLSLHQFCEFKSVESRLSSTITSLNHLYKYNDIKRTFHEHLRRLLLRTCSSSSIYHFPQPSAGASGRNMEAGTSRISSHYHCHATSRRYGCLLHINCHSEHSSDAQPPPSSLPTTNSPPSFRCISQRCSSALSADVPARSLCSGFRRSRDGYIALLQPSSSRLVRPSCCRHAFKCRGVFSHPSRRHSSHASHNHSSQFSRLHDGCN